MLSEMSLIAQMEGLREAQLNFCQIDVEVLSSVTSPGQVKDWFLSLEQELYLRGISDENLKKKVMLRHIRKGILPGELERESGTLENLMDDLWRRWFPKTICWAMPHGAAYTTNSGHGRGGRRKRRSYLSPSIRRV